MNLYSKTIILHTYHLSNIMMNKREDLAISRLNIMRMKCFPEPGLYLLIIGKVYQHCYCRLLKLQKSQDQVF